MKLDRQAHLVRLSLIIIICLLMTACSRSKGTDPLAKVFAEPIGKVFETVLTAATSCALFTPASLLQETVTMHLPYTAVIETLYPLIQQQNISNPQELYARLGHDNSSALLSWLAAGYKASFAENEKPKYSFDFYQTLLARSLMAMAQDPVKSKSRRNRWIFKQAAFEKNDKNETVIQGAGLTLIYDGIPAHKESKSDSETITIFCDEPATK